MFPFYLSVVSSRSHLSATCVINIYVIKANCLVMNHRGKSVRSWCERSSDRSFMGIDPYSYFLFQPVLHDWCPKAVVCAIMSVGWCI